jgi:hypothetical protein
VAVINSAVMNNGLRKSVIRNLLQEKPYRVHSGSVPGSGSRRDGSRNEVALHAEDHVQCFVPPCRR